MAAGQTKGKRAKPDQPAELLRRLKSSFLASRHRAAMAVNIELISQLQEIGKTLAERRRIDGWTESNIKSFADLLRDELGLTALTREDILLTRDFFLAYDTSGEWVQHCIKRLTWSHHKAILSTVADADAREWYVMQTFQSSWGVSELESQIAENAFHQRQKPPRKKPMNTKRQLEKIAQMESALVTIDKFFRSEAKKSKRK